MVRPMMPREVRRRFWVGMASGESLGEAAARVGVSVWQAHRWFNDAGGVIPSNARSYGRPASCPAPQGKRLAMADREEIAHLRTAGMSPSQIADRLGVHRCTVYRELARGTTSPTRPYRASTAQAAADQRARRPKVAKLASSARLRAQVQQRLESKHSPRQIAARLRVDFPEDAEMSVSHETIYRALYVQSRGGLRREMTRHLRSQRRYRKPQRRRAGQARGQCRFPGMVMIADRPPQIEDRAVPGHWEGDLIMGSIASNSAIGTLVERATRFTMLLHLPHGYDAYSVQQAMTVKMADLSDQLRRTLTWDQGKEMANHAQITEATGLDIYFCDPHSPWQRGSNENTNGLLRQYFPKGSDLSQWGPGYLDMVAAELNNRPRQTLTWATPAERLDQLLSDPHGVALTD